MSATNYSYSIANDFPNQKVSAESLKRAIEKSKDIMIGLDFIETKGDVCNVLFKDGLSTDEKGFLDTIVAEHDGEHPQGLNPVSSKGIPLVQLDGPVTPGDNKPIFVEAPATDGLFTWFTSHGDDLSADPIGTGRGKGQKIFLEFQPNDPLEKFVEWQFIEPIEVHDGQVSWGPEDLWSHDDEFSFSVVIDSNSPLASSTPGVGNVNEVDLGNGQLLYIPAAGDGGHTIDLKDARPVSAPTSGTGFWNVDKATGEITPNASGTGDWMLLGYGVEAFFISGVTMGHPGGWFDVDVYKTDWIHQNWKLRFAVKRGQAPSARATAGAWSYIFRGSNVRA